LRNEIGTSRQRRLHRRHDVVVDDGIRVRKNLGNGEANNDVRGVSLLLPPLAPIPLSSSFFFVVWGEGGLQALTSHDTSLPPSLDQGDRDLTEEHFQKIFVVELN
jgi:hypothetical protein